LAVLGLNTNFFESILSESEEEESRNNDAKEDISKAGEEEKPRDKVRIRLPSKERSPLQGSSSSTSTSYEAEDEGNDNVPADSDPVEKTEIRPPSTYKPTVRRVSSPTPHPSIAANNTKKLQPFKPFGHTTRTKAPKTVTSTSSSTSTSTSISTSSRQGTPAPAPARKPSTISLQGVDLEDPKIPVITGIGHRVSTSPNTGSVVPVRVTPSPSTPVPKRTTTTSTTQSAPHISSTGSHSHNHNHVRPNNLIFAEKSDIHLREIERNGDSIVLQWESHKQTGFRIIYRLFGEDTFRHGPPLAPTEREYRIQSIPYNVSSFHCT
jgi:hypothetical protein